MYEDYSYESKIPKGMVIDKYKRSMYRILSRMIDDQLTPMEINEGINYSIAKRYEKVNAQIHNNYTNRTAEMDLVDLCDQIVNNNIIMTSQGFLFCKHGEKPNPFYNFIQFLLDMRAYAKNEMKKYPKGSEEWKSWNLKQNNYKVSCNAVYGCCGNYRSIFYNLYVCTAVTGQGRGCISASILFFEAFLADNVHFESLNEVMQFIDDVQQDQSLPINNKFRDEDTIDNSIRVEDCYLRIINICGTKEKWIPTDEECKMIWRTICNLDQKTINRLYYKNNLYQFCNNSKIRNLIMSILIKLEKPFLNPLKAPKEVEYELELLYDLLYEYVYHRHLFIDKLERIYTMKRDVILVTDTDSCIITLDEWYRKVLPLTIGIPMNIKYTRAEIDKEVDKTILRLKKSIPEKEYDYYNDRLVDVKRYKFPLVVIEQDNLRYSIVNILSYILGKLIRDYMILFGENYQTGVDHRDCLLIMKNEFLFKSLFLTDGSKNYSSLQVVQEGNIVPEDKQFTITGMPMTKVGTPDEMKTKLQNLLEYDILRKSFVDQVDIIKKLTTMEKEIYQSLLEGSTIYYKPTRIKAMSSYATPMGQQGIKASYAYNYILDKDGEQINLSQRNSILIIKTDITKKNVDKILEEFPDKYIKIKELLDTDAYKNGITSIALPLDTNVPEWIKPFIDYNEIIQDNLRNFPLEELGITKMNNDSKITHTNIVEL